MHQNITKVAERGERLDALQDKTGECGAPADRTGWRPGRRELTPKDNLAVSAQGFRRGANRVRKQMWCVILCSISERVLTRGEVERHANANHHRRWYLRLDRHHCRPHRQVVSSAVTVIGSAQLTSCSVQGK